MGKLDLSKPLKTKDGRPVRIISREAKGTYPVIGLIMFDGEEVPKSYTEDGAYSAHGTGSFDLENVPEPEMVREGWANIYGDWVGSVCGTKELADYKALCAGVPRLACVKVEIKFREGDGL